MYLKKICLQAPGDFSFWRTVLSHGWCALQPFHVNRSRKTLKRILRTQKQLALVQAQEGQDGRIEIAVKTHHPLTVEETKEIRRQIAYVFRFDESLQEFYEVLLRARDNGHLRWIAKVKAGRLLRSPSLFEDIVKMICTTNCSWSATERMIENLVQKIGTPFDAVHTDFPTAQQLAANSESFLLKQVRTGYRSSYLIELANRVASGKLDLNLLLSEKSGDLYKQLLSLKGIGPYAAGNLLRLIGHYEHLALDSWCRQEFARIYRQGRTTSDKAIAKHYQTYGRWKGLVMWLDLTRDWFEETRTVPF